MKAFDGYFDEGVYFDYRRTAPTIAMPPAFEADSIQMNSRLFALNSMLTWAL